MPMQEPKNKNILGKYFALNNDHVFSSLDNETARRVHNEIALNRTALKARLNNFGLFSRIIEKKIKEGVCGN